MHLAEKVACLFFLALSVLVGAGSCRLGLGTPQQPESGFLPFWTAVLLCLLSIAHLIRLRSPASREENLGQLRLGEHWKRAVVLILALAIYALSLPVLGYLIDTLVLMAVLFRLYKRQRWWVVLGSSLLVIGITHFIFNFALKIQLPKGILGIG